MSAKCRALHNIAPTSSAQARAIQRFGATASVSHWRHKSNAAQKSHPDNGHP